jgi:hypothetical protein
MAPAVLVIQTLRDEPVDVGVIAGGSIVLFLLTLARMGGLASEVASQSERKRAMQTVLRATEQERVRLAADLHDGPVQELTALRYGLTRARNRIQRGQLEQAEGLLAELEDELAAGITGLRRLMAELRPAVLDEQGLEVALHNQVRAFEATSGVACAISTGLKSRLDPDLETVLYRVTQATLNNVGKHAGASRVTVSLAAENGSVRLRINDDAATSASTQPPAKAPPSTSRWPTAPWNSSAASSGSGLSSGFAAAAGPPCRHHGVADAVGAAVLGEEGEGAGGLDRSGGFLGLVGGEDDHADRRVLLDNLLGRLEAVGGRHPKVHQDHVGAEGVDHGDTLDPVGGLPDDLDAGVLEHAPDGVADGGGVVDQQHPGAVLRLRGLSLAVLLLGHRLLVPI